MRTGHTIVDEISTWALEGNILHHAWFEHPIFRMTSTSGASERKRAPKVNLIALVVLADVIYWHKSGYDRDEDTNRVLGVHKKFSGDKLKYIYAKRAEYFGLTECQIKDAVRFLHNAGLIERTVVRPWNDVYIVPNLKMIWTVTFGGEIRPQLEQGPALDTTGAGISSNSTPPQLQPMRTKEITEGNNKEITTTRVDDIAASLFALGVKPKSVCVTLASMECAARQIDWWPHRRGEVAKWEPGTLRKTIEQDWDAPKSLAKQVESQAQEQEAQKKRAAATDRLNRQRTECAAAYEKVWQAQPEGYRKAIIKDTKGDEAARLEYIEKYMANELAGAIRGKK